MFDDFSKRSKAVRAALDLAKEQRLGRHRPHRHRRTQPISASPISGASSPARATSSAPSRPRSMPRCSPRRESPAKRKARATGCSMSIMTRFEVMQPYKPALKRIAAYLRCRPGEAAPLLCGSLASQYWMLAGAGAKLDGPGGALRVAGLTAIYGKVFQVWLDDDTPSLDKTMAALDKRLGKGERMLSGVETACGDALPVLAASCRAAGSAAAEHRGAAPSPGPASSARALSGMPTSQSGRSSSSSGPERSSGPSPGSSASTGSPRFRRVRVVRHVELRSRRPAALAGAKHRRAALALDRGLAPADIELDLRARLLLLLDFFRHVLGEQRGRRKTWPAPPQRPTIMRRMKCLLPMVLVPNFKPELLARPSNRRAGTG